MISEQNLHAPPRPLAALEHLSASSAKCAWVTDRGRRTEGGTQSCCGPGAQPATQTRYHLLLRCGMSETSHSPDHRPTCALLAARHVYSRVLYSVATHAHTPCIRTAGRRPCSPLLSRVHILVHTAAPPIADAYSCGYSCLHSCLLCSCLMVWSGTAVMAYDGAGTAGSKRHRKAAPRFVFDEYCHAVWRASEKFCRV